METIKIQNLEIYEVLDHTCYSYVSKCKYEGNYYCLKEIMTQRLNDVLDNIKIYDKVEEKEGLVIPKYIVKNTYGNIGYLTDYIDNCHNLNEQNDYCLSSKIDILMDAREKLDYFHNNYGFIHGDLHPGNICYNDKQSYLIDFDNTGKRINIENLTCLAKKYIECNGVDKGLDIFMFNMSSYSFINEISFKDAFYALDSYRGNFKTKESINIINKMKKLRKDDRFLIDYV